MRILLIHSDFIEYEPKKKALKSAEDVEKGKHRVKEALVAFTSVEKADEKDPKAIVSKAVNEIKSVNAQVKADNIVVYPFVHLSAEPSSPAVALDVLKGIEENLLKDGLKVKRAPFGWYKAFDIRCKGHPLAELSKQISTEGKAEEVSEAVKKEETLKSSWYVLEPGGKMHPVEIAGKEIKGYDFSKDAGFGKLAKYEMAKDRTVRSEPPHIQIMKRLGLANYEPASDPGHFRFLPKGRMVKALLEEWVTRSMLEYGALEVETPIMYDYEHPALKDYLQRFPARQYTIETPNKKAFLRFAACFGQFLMSHDANISYRNLPLRMYELTKYSFRVEQRGELAGLRRLRAFTMPDCHALCRDVAQAKEEMLVRFDVSKKMQEKAGLSLKDDFQFSMRIVKDFFEENKEFVFGLVKKMGKPVLLEMWDKRFFYFIFKVEWNFMDALDKAACLTTDQIDVENGERYDILFTDKDNQRKQPVILHLSPSGSIERVIYALLEKAHMKQQAGKNPMLPLWLSPTQVRLCPVSDDFTRDCVKIADALSKSRIRVDVDDRSESVGKKIRDAEIEWVPYIVVVGKKELESKSLAVRFRETGKVDNMKTEKLAKLISRQTEGMPFRPLPLPKLLTKRADFF